MPSQPAAARQYRILQLFSEGETPAIGSMAETFGVSTATIRRDLKELDKQGKLHRVYGGALPIGAPAQQPLSVRLGEAAPTKLAIGRLVAGLVRRDQWVFVGGGSTTVVTARCLAAGPPLRVITHMPAIADVMIERGKHRVLLTGGEYDPKYRNLVGNIVFDILSDRAFDIAILGAYGVDETRGIVDNNEFGHRLNRFLMQRSRRTVWVMDASKFGRPSHLCTAAFGTIDTIVTNQAPPAGIARRLAETDATVIWQPEHLEGEVDD